jgi:putative ABC transport system ATP-binding protein
MDIRLINVNKDYRSIDDQFLRSLEGVNIDINYQNYVSFVGPSGSGKSTLLNIITGVLRPTSGDVYWGKTSLSKASDVDVSSIRRSKFGIVFQDARFINEMTVEENILLPLVITSTDIRQKKKYYQTLLERMNIVKLRNRFPEELSGGEKKKVAIVRALINNPEILVADEPTSNLDETSAREVFNIFSNLNRLGLTIVIATHDERFGAYCNETYWMSHGKIDKFTSRSSS